MSGDRRNPVVWITWESHRRSRELAEHFGADYIEFVTNWPNPFRYMLLGARTIFLIARRRPRVVFVQNPSIILAALVCATRSLHRAKVYVDRHTNYYFDTMSLPSLKWKVYHAISRFTDRSASGVIVTNAFLQKVVAQNGGTGFVLPDPLPEFDPSGHQYDGKRRARVVFVGSGAPDEPLAAVISAAASRVESLDLVVTSGGAKRAAAGLRLPTNVRFTGFVPYSDYVDLLRTADLVVVLTTIDYTLCCGAYEAVSLGRPTVLSSYDTIRAYFSAGARYADPTENSIGMAIDDALKHWETLYQETLAQAERLRGSWRDSFEALRPRLLSEIP